MGENQPAGNRIEATVAGGPELRRRRNESGQTADEGQPAFDHEVRSKSPLLPNRPLRTRLQGNAPVGGAAGRNDEGNTSEKDDLDAELSASDEAQSIRHHGEDEEEEGNEGSEEEILDEAELADLLLMYEEGE